MENSQTKTAAAIMLALGALAGVNDPAHHLGVPVRVSSRLPAPDAAKRRAKNKQARKARAKNRG